VADKLINFYERTWVQQHLNALARSLLALGVLLLDCGLTGGMNRLVIALLEISNLAGGGS
jgi:hypothetical protein